MNSAGDEVIRVNDCGREYSVNSVRDKMFRVNHFGWKGLISVQQPAKENMQARRPDSSKANDDLGRRGLVALEMT